MPIEHEIQAFEKMREELEKDHMGKWVLFNDGKLLELYDSFNAAAEDAVRRLGRGPYLIRQVGAPALTLPASVVYHPIYADR
jgi:hypothetical protein